MMSSVSVNPLRGVYPWLAVIGILLLSACSTIQSPPTAQSIAGLTPVGTVTLTETVAGGATGGTGTLTFQGHSYPFTLVGSVIGLGGASQVHAVGEVYKLNRSFSINGGSCWINSLQMPTKTRGHHQRHLTHEETMT